MFGRMQAYKEVYTMLETAESAAVNLAEQIKNPNKDYSYGQSK